MQDVVAEHLPSNHAKTLVLQMRFGSYRVHSAMSKCSAEQFLPKRAFIEKYNRQFQGVVFPDNIGIAPPLQFVQRSG